MYESFTGFNNLDKIVFVGLDGTLKQMDPDGTNVETIASAESPYSFGGEAYFQISPDKNKILIIENRVPCDIYEQCNNQRLVMIDLLTMDRTILMEEYLGDWNVLMWRPDSSGFYYAYHEFLPGGGRIHKIVVGYISGEGEGTVTDLSDSDLNYDKENDNFFGLFTESNNLLDDQGLYDGETGMLLTKNTSAPNVFENQGLFGFDEDGIYFADSDGTNFVKYVEPQITSPSKGMPWLQLLLEE